MLFGCILNHIVTYLAEPVFELYVVKVEPLSVNDFMMTDPSDTFGFVIAPEFDMLPPERLAIEHEYVKRVDPPPDGGVVSDVTSGVVSDVTSGVVSDF